MDETDNQAIKNFERLNRHSERLNDLLRSQSADNAVLKKIDRKLSDDFFKKLDELYEWAKVDNGKLSMNSWRRDVDMFLDSLRVERKQNAQAKAEELTSTQQERRKWLHSIIMFAIGAVFTVIMTLVGK